MSRAGSVLVMLAGVLALLVLGGAAAVLGVEHLQRGQCERLGHVYSPVRPDGRLSLCWVQP